MHHYVLRAHAGQRLIITPHTTTGQIILVLSGVDGQVFLSGRVGSTDGKYDGILPATQDYLLSVQTEDGNGAGYILEINMPAEVAGPDVTIVGTVSDVSFSARIIMLTEQVDGVGVIALSEDAMIVTNAGQAITLHDIQKGMKIQASGQPGKSDALLASQVRLPEDMTTPPNHLTIPKTIEGVKHANLSD
jgi:hypothetical protein